MKCRNLLWLRFRAFGFNFAPRGWMLCDGRILPISQYTALFSLLGTTYGGNGTSTFGLPNLQGRVPMHPGHGPGLSTYVLGEISGSETVTVLSSEMPIHTHSVQAATGGTAEAVPGSATWLGVSAPARAYVNADPTVQMSTKAIAVSGGSQSHENMQPFLTINFCIAYEGIYPSRN